ncbi:ABC transporter G family member 20-like [Oppia nitens]|uniref:ABC transporter G family member 20-like n=1 Tax=Oppia nitens TaxID=1686743 RepID=UPI0023DCB91D|nr:ABC transporter G family member 20-like [Oppia nitens]
METRNDDDPTNNLPTMATATTIKLAEQSAANHTDKRTGRRLIRFSVRQKQLLDNIDDNNNNKNKKKKKDKKNKKKMKDMTTPMMTTTQQQLNDPYGQTVDKIQADNTDTNKQVVIDVEQQRKLGDKIDTEINVHTIGARKKHNVVDSEGQEPSSVTDKDDDPSSEEEDMSDKIGSLDWDHLMVKVRELCFSYGRSNKQFIHQLDMSIPKSAIYALLGPSGCGKTTLLKLILGILKPKSGTVKVNDKLNGDPLNHIPGKGVGFMPQDLALFQEITVNEALKYFSKIYGMTDEQTLSSIKFLVDFLDLPDPERRIDTLSGGQKRRVSLSLSLVHNPPLLILDEPTVGTDPVLRERIWKHLVILSQQKSTSIIITTHYIEEARRAHMISLMRSGKILVEHSPKHLLNHFGISTLEQVFLKMCTNTNNSNDDGIQLPQSYLITRNKMTNTVDDVYTDDSQGNTMIKIDKTVMTVNGQPMKSLPSVSTMQRVKTQTHKNFLRVMRNKPLLIFQTILPTIIIIIFCLCIGTKPYGLPVAVYNGEYDQSVSADNSSLSTMILSPAFLRQVDNKTITFKHFRSNKTALETVHDDNGVYGAIIIQNGFTASLAKRFNNKELTSDEDIDKSTIKFYGDFSDMIITQTITKVLIDAEFDFLREVINKYVVSKSQAKRQIRVFDPLVEFVDPPVFGSIDPKFRDYIAPGIVMSCIYFMALGLTAMTLVIERKEGLMERSIVAGLKLTEILVAQVIVQFFIVTLQTILLMIFTFLVFEVPNNGNILYVIVLVLMQGVAGMSFGLLISAFCKTENSTIMVALGCFYPFLLISGIIWPLEGMPYELRLVSYCLPQTLAIIALRNIMLKGYHIGYMWVFLGYLSTIAWMAIFLVLAIVVFKHRK